MGMGQNCPKTPPIWPYQDERARESMVRSVHEAQSESLYTETYRGTWRKELGIFEGYAFTKTYQSPAKEIAV
jgi:hypothetical protein